MEKTLEWVDQTIAIAVNQQGERLVMVIHPDPSLLENMGGHPVFDGSETDSKNVIQHLQPGIYSATIEFWFQQGYSDGYKADGESEWEFAFVDVKPYRLVGLYPLREKHLTAAGAKTVGTAVRA